MAVVLGLWDDDVGACCHLFIQLALPAEDDGRMDATRTLYLDVRYPEVRERRSRAFGLI